MTDQPVPLQRSAYHDPFSNQVIIGNASTQQNALDMEQYYQPLERFHASGLHGWGVVAGLRVTATLNAIGATVLPGIALDSNGLHILLVSGGQADVRTTASANPSLLPVTNHGVVVPTSGLTGDRYLVLQFSETFDGSSDPARYTHTPWLHFLDATQPVASDGSLLVLARLTFGTGSSAGLVSALPQDLRRRVNEQLEHTHEANLHGPAVVSGLGITATLNTAGISVQTGLALDGRGAYIPLLSGGQAEVGPTADAPGSDPSLLAVSGNGLSLPTTGLTGNQYLTIQFWESLLTNEALPATLESVAPEHFIATPWLRFVPTTGFVNDGTRVILATISFGSGTSAGLVTAVALDQRPTTDLGLGSLHFQKNTLAVSGNTLTAASTEAGVLRASTSGNGVSLTVPNASDEIHLERDDAGNFSKLALAAETIVARRSDGTSGVIINTENGSLSSASLTAGAISATTSLNSPAISAGTISATTSLSSPALTAGTISATTSLNSPAISANTVSASTSLSSPALTAGTISATTSLNSPTITGSAISASTSLSSPAITAGTISATTSLNSPTVTANAINVSSLINSPDLRAGSVETSSLSVTGEAIVQNATFTPTIVLNGNIATLDVGASGSSGFINVHDKSFITTCTINGDSGKITANTLFLNNGILFVTNSGTFGGSVTVEGSLNVFGSISKSGGGFKIDHPLDPEHKYLSHSFVESPDMKNFYDGVVTLDANGEAVVTLPDWFSALNRDVRYQLTCIGGYAPVYIAQEIKGNSFSIAGGKPKMSVSWLITGIRQDAWANANRIHTDTMKTSGTTPNPSLPDSSGDTNPPPNH